MYVYIHEGGMIRWEQCQYQTMQCYSDHYNITWYFKNSETNGIDNYNYKFVTAIACRHRSIYCCFESFSPHYYIYERVCVHACLKAWSYAIE